MANTYSQIYLHFIFGVKDGFSCLPVEHLPRIHAYISSIARQLGHYPYAVGGIGNHVHLLVGYNINQAVPDFMRELKSSVSKFINENRFIPCRFEWQRGYGCFSYAQSQIDTVCRYIANQAEHHKRMTLGEEMKQFLDRYNVSYDERYILR